MDNIKKLFTAEKTSIFLFSFIILLLSFSPLIYNIYITPPGTYFPLIHNHLLDYHLYLHYMRQAYEGSWLIVSRYTPEDFPARFAYPVYLFLGKFARLTSLSLPITYTLSRLAGGILLLGLIYKLTKLIYPASKAQRVLAFFLVLFGGGFWTISQSGQGFAINTMLSYWTENDVVGRLTYVPHHLMAKVIMLSSFLLLTKALKQKSFKLLAASSFVGLLTGFASPFVALNQEIIMAITTIAVILVNLYHKKSSKLYLIYLFTYMFFSGLSLVYFRWLEQSGYPWSVYLDWEKGGFLVTFGEYLLFSGPNLIFSILGFAFFLRQKNFLSLLLLSWFVESWIGIFLLAPFFPVQNMRFLAGAYFIPLGVIAAKGFFHLTDILSRFVRRKKAIIIGVVLFLTCLVFAGNIFANLKFQSSFFSPYYYNVYLSRDLLAAFSFLDLSTPKKSVVLSGGYIANLIPAYAHNKTVHGHPTQTYQAQEKDVEAIRFFAQDDVEFSRNLLQKYRISYVFFAQDTPPPRPDFIDALGLSKIYSNTLVTIYKTN